MVKNNVYVQNEDGSIFLVSLNKKLSNLDINDLNRNYLYYDLDMMAFKDYYDENNNNIGYCSKYQAVSEVRYENMILYCMDENLKDKLEAYGYTIIDNEIVENLTIHFNEVSKYELIEEVTRLTTININDQLEELCKDLFIKENIDKYKNNPSFFYEYLKEKITR